MEETQKQKLRPAHQECMARKRHDSSHAHFLVCFRVGGSHFLSMRARLGGRVRIASYRSSASLPCSSCFGWSSRRCATFVGAMPFRRNSSISCVASSWRKHTVVPFIRVQNTDTRQGPLLRMMGACVGHDLDRSWIDGDPRLPAAEAERCAIKLPNSLALPKRMCSAWNLPILSIERNTQAARTYGRAGGHACS